MGTPNLVLDFMEQERRRDSFGPVFARCVDKLEKEQGFSVEAAFRI